LAFLEKLGFQKMLAFAALVILYIFFSIFGVRFLSLDTFLTILGSAYFIAFLAIGVTFVIITGGIDLSIGAGMICCAIIGGLVYNTLHVPLPLAIIIMILFGALIGLINGLLVTIVKLPPFIATLGTMMMSLGFGSIVTNVSTQTFPTMYDADNWYKYLFISTQNKFPTGLIFLVIFFALASVVLNKTKIGRYIYGMGSNEEAVRLSGVNVTLWKTLAYVICGVFMGLAAIFYSAMFTRIIPNTGNGFELLAIAGVVIGGTSLAGGIGTLSGTMIGVFIMSVLKTGLVSMNQPPQWQTFLTGVVLILAVALDVWRNSKKV